jgi:cyclase
VLAALALCAGCAMQRLLWVESVALAPDVRAFVGGGANSLALLHGREAFLVDPKTGDAARRLRRRVEEDLGKTVRRLLLTHHHVDPTDAFELYEQVGAVLAHPRTRQRVEQKWRVAVDRSVRWVEVEDDVRLVLGGQEVRIRYFGVGHTDGDLVAYLPAQGLLVAGDLFLHGFEPDCDVAAGGNLLEWRRTLDRVLELPFERVAPGHGELASRADLMRYRDYLAAMEAEVRRTREVGASEDEAASRVALEGWERWASFPYGGDRRANVRQMYRAVEEEAKSARP